MGYIVAFVVALFIGWKLGYAYRDFQDLMTARRIAKQIKLSEDLARDMDEWRRALEIDKKREERRKQLQEVNQ